jgi:transcription elongation factor GreA
MQEIMPISHAGDEKLKAELDELKKEAAELRQRVAEAREQGDLKENGEYIYGRQNLAFVEGRMQEIMGKINYSEVTDCTAASLETAGFGTVVKVRDLDSGDELVYQLLGPYDSDLTENSISILSPIGNALYGLGVGEKVTVKVPRGETNFEILEITASEFK